MKHLYFITLALLWALPSYAQNLVPNGSFEDYAKCPVHYSNFSGYIKSWYRYNWGTPDYFNACNGTTESGVPANRLGNQSAADGQAYVGILVYSLDLDFAEYVGIQLKDKLRPGVVYEVSMSVSLAESAYLGIDGLAAIFTQGTQTITNQKLVSRTPHISYKNYGVITDDQHWTRLVDSFTADRYYDNIVIGNFTANPNIVRRTLFEQKMAYYFIDSVVVKPVGGKPAPPVNIDLEDTTVCIGDSLILPYAIAHEDSLFIGTSFSLDLLTTYDSVIQHMVFIGDSTGVIRIGTGGFPPGKLSLRLISSATSDTVYYSRSLNLYPYPTINASADDTACGQDMKLHLTSNLDVKVTWYGPNGFYATDKQPVIPAVNSVNSGNYIVKADAAGGCSVSDTVTVNISCTDIQVPLAFSPNGDGINDILYLYGTENIKELSFKVYNRWGNVVFETTNMHTGWDGSYNGVKMDTETLAYILHVVHNNGKVQQQSGNITVVR